jgi:hypothetical protein
MRKRILILICIGFLFWGCPKEPNDVCPQLLFNFFLLDKDGNSLFTSLKQPQVDFYYFVGTERWNYNGSFIRSIDSGPYRYYYQYEVNAMNTGIHEYYIQVKDDIDTIHMEVMLRPFPDCNDLTLVHLNGQPPIQNLPSAPYNMPGFILQKKN